MITEARKLAFQKLIDDAPIYVPGPKKEKPAQETIIIKDDRPSTIAAAFEADSKVMHKYNSTDGFSIYSNDQYQQIKDDKELRIHIRRFLER